VLTNVVEQPVSLTRSDELLNDHTGFGAARRDWQIDAVISQRLELATLSAHSAAAPTTAEGSRAATC